MFMPAELAGEALEVGGDGQLAAAGRAGKGDEIGEGGAGGGNGLGLRRYGRFSRRGGSCVSGWWKGVYVRGGFPNGGVPPKGGGTGAEGDASTMQIGVSHF